MKKEPEDGRPTLADTPELPALPTLDPQRPEVPAPEANEGEPPLKIKKEPESESPCALSELFGDVFVVKVEAAQSLSDKIQSEIKGYKSEATMPLNFDSDPKKKGKGPLEWWKEMAIKYPILSTLAKQFLGVPATSVASERVFSTAGDIVTAQRACLSGDNVDKLIFLTKNMQIPEDLV